MKGLKLVGIVGAIAVAGLGIGMAATNPGREAYEEYASEQLAVYVKEEICPDLGKAEGSFESILQRQCQNLVDVGRPQLRQLVARSTQRQNFGIFSIYRTDLSVNPALPEFHFETLGIFQSFITYETRQE